MFRKILHPEKKEDLVVQLPEEFLGKEIKVEVDELNGKEKMDENRKRKVEKAFKFFTTLSEDMSNFKFNREEANER